MKRNTRNRKRRLTAAQKRLASAAGLDPTQFFYAGDNERYFFLIGRTDDKRVSVPKPEK